MSTLARASSTRYSLTLERFKFGTFDFDVVSSRVISLVCAQDKSWSAYDIC